MEPFEGEDVESQDITFSDQKKRAKVEAYGTMSKFRPGDEVYYCPPGTSVRGGPYIVASVPSLKIYTLCDENAMAVKNGNMINEKDLIGTFEAM